MRNTEDKQLDELLSKAFRKQYENETASGPDEATLDAMHPFTEEHSKKAEELSRKNKKHSSIWKTYLGKAAAVVLCVVTATGVITMSNPKIRGRVSNTVTHFIDEYIAFDFSDSSDDDRINIANTKITYIPEGFSLTEDNSDKKSISHIYSNSDGEVIIIDIKESSDINLMTDADTHDTRYSLMNGYDCYISYSDEMKQGSVYFGSSYFTVAISGMTEKDELIKIAENIKFKD